MNFPQDQIDELKMLYPGIQYAPECGLDYFLVPKLKLPANCSPGKVDVLFCPNQRDGYNSRLFFEAVVESGKALNWNAKNTMILSRQWNAFSWKLASSGCRLSQMLVAHLRGLTC